MRDHLLALREIQAALPRSKSTTPRRWQKAPWHVLPGLHGAHEVAHYVPKGKQVACTEMHRSANRFVVAARDATVTNDMRPALTALWSVMAASVACHAKYRFR